MVCPHHHYSFLCTFFLHCHRLRSLPPFLQLMSRWWWWCLHEVSRCCSCCCLCIFLGHLCMIRHYSGTTAVIKSCVRRTGFALGRKITRLPVVVRSSSQSPVAVVVWPDVYFCKNWRLDCVWHDPGGLVSGPVWSLLFFRCFCSCSLVLTEVLVLFSFFPATNFLQVLIIT